MTDKEMAEEYLEELRRQKIPFDIYEVNNQLKLAYIAGLKAGRWHTPDEKLPEECTTVVAYGLGDEEPTTFYFVCSDQWEWIPRRIAVLTNEQIKKWCEIPKE